MHNAYTYTWLDDAKTSRRRTKDTAEKFLNYSKYVLELIKQDVAGGAKIDVQVVRDLERAIARHEAPASCDDKTRASERRDRLVQSRPPSR